MEGPGRLATIDRDIRDFLQHARNPYWVMKLRCLPLYSRRLSIEICAPRIGFFAHLNWCLHTAGFCDQRHLTPLLSATSPQYGDPSHSSNRLSHFFDVSAPAGRPDFKISDLNQLGIGARSGLSTIKIAADLREKYLPVKLHIMAKVANFIAEKMPARKVLGIHFRGTDKKKEAERVSWEYVRQTVVRYLEHNPSYNCLFVASDEAQFISFIENAFSSLPVVSHEDSFRSITGQPFHTDDHEENNYRKAEEALINCLLLSRCETVIRTTSFLSAWASIFNPELKIVLLNRPFQQYLWFPERLLIPQSMDNYLSPFPVVSDGA